MVKPVLDDIFFAKRENMLYLLSFLVVVLYLVKGFLSYTHNYQMSYIGNATVTRLRDELFASIQRQPLSFFDGEATGVLMSRLTYDVNLLQDAVTRVVTSFFKDTFTVIGLSAVIFYREWRLALMAMVVFPLAVLIIVHLGKRVRRMSHASQVANAYLYTVLQESLIGQRIVKAFARETYEEQRFFRANWDYFNIRMKLNATRELSPPVMEFLGSLGMAGIILYGGYAVIRGASTPGTFFSFLAALLMLYQPIKSLSSVQNIFQEGLAAAVRVFGLMDREPEIADAPGAVTLKHLAQEIGYAGVSFAYDGRENVLHDINFTVRRGEVVALVGPSGAGKSTLLNLLPRFYDATGGAIMIDGHDIRAVTLASLRGQIGVVTQQTILFNDTVRHNVAYGRLEASEAEILEALKAAYAYDFVMAMPQGLTPSSASRGCASPAANASAWPSPGPCSRTRPSSSWTKPPPAWTPNPSGRCSRPWTGSSSGAPPWSSPTASPRCATPTASSPWKTAASWKSAPTPNSWPRTASTAASTRCSSPGRRKVLQTPAKPGPRRRSNPL
jgi:subfamily B ATP-binding cassette protein MsbA